MRSLVAEQLCCWRPPPPRPSRVAY
jgi:hypothetical protein